MKFLIFSFIVLLAVSANCVTIEVTNSEQFTSALDSVRPGDIIILHDGSYNGTFELTRGGNAADKITITGSNKAILSSSSYGFHLKANFTILSGFTVENALKGIVLDGAHHNVLDSLVVQNIDEEGIVVRKNSSNNVIQNSIIHDTGSVNLYFGEGITIGTAVNTWVNGYPDLSSNNNILNNTIGPNISSQNVDLKEGTCCGIVRGNYLNSDDGENFSDSSLSVKGDLYLIEENTSIHSRLNGFDVTLVVSARMGGCNNTIQNNICRLLPLDGYNCAVNQSPFCENTLINNIYIKE